MSAVGRRAEKGFVFMNKILAEKVKIENREQAQSQGRRIKNLFAFSGFLCIALNLSIQLSMNNDQYSVEFRLQEAQSALEIEN